MVKKILFILFVSLFAYQSFGQGFAEESRAKKAFNWIRTNDITTLDNFIWHGDTIDFSNLVDSSYITVGDSDIYVTHPFLDSVIATLPGGHDPVTMGTTATSAGLSINASQVMEMVKATSTTNGYLGWTDFVYFYNKLTTVSHDETLTGYGTVLSPLKVDTTLLATKSDLDTITASRTDTASYLDGTWFGHDTTYFITVIDDDAYSAAWDGDMDATSKNSIYDYLESLSFGATNLSNTASPTTVTVESSTGSDTNLPLADHTNAGLLSPGDKAKLDTLRYPIDTIYAITDSTFPIEYINYTSDVTEVFITDVPKPDGIYSGGIVTWQEGLLFSISPAAYYINGVLYISPSDTMTLTTADGKNSRIDLFVVDTLGQATFITGTPGANPQTPQYDPSSQLPLTSVLILANDTIPSPTPGSDTLITEVVYDENIEWTSGYSGVVTDFNSTSIPYSGSISASASTVSDGDYISFTSGTNVNFSTYETLSFWIQLKEAILFKDKIMIQLFLDNVPVTPLNELNVNKGITTWQNIGISIAGLGSTSGYFDEIRINYSPFKAATTFSGFYFDYLILQGGISVPIVYGDDWGDQVAVTDNSTILGNGTQGNVLRIDTSLIATKYDIDTLGSAIRDSLINHRSEIVQIYDSLTIHREEINDLYDSVYAHRTEITNIYDSLYLHREDITNLYDSITIINTRVNNLFDSITNINVDIQNLFDSITEINNKILLLEGDDWGTQVVVSDGTLNGTGITGNPLSVDTSLIATKYDIDTLSLTVQNIVATTGWNFGMQSLSGTTITWDADSGLGATLTITGNTTISFSNLEAGMMGNIDVTCNAAGYTLEFSGVTVDTSPYLSATSDVITTTAGAGAKDTYSWWYTGSVLKVNGTKGYE